MVTNRDCHDYVASSKRTRCH